MRTTNKLMLALLLTASACGPKPEAFHPVTVAADDGAFGRAMRGVVMAGNAVETSDEKSGVITTKWEETHLIMETWNRLRWTIIVANGQMTISSQCQIQDRDNSVLIENKWRECDGQPAGRNEKAQQLAEQIRASK